MTHDYTELRKAAENSQNTTHPDEVAWYASDTLVNKGVAYIEDANFITLANPATILALLNERLAANQVPEGCEDEGCPHYGTLHSHGKPKPSRWIDGLEGFWRR